MEFTSFYQRAMVLISQHRLACSQGQTRTGEPFREYQPAVETDSCKITCRKDEYYSVKRGRTGNCIYNPITVCFIFFVCLFLAQNKAQKDRPKKWMYNSLMLAKPSLPLRIFSQLPYATCVTRKGMVFRGAHLCTLSRTRLCILGIPSAVAQVWPLKPTESSLSVHTSPDPTHPSGPEGLQIAFTPCSHSFHSVNQASIMPLL